MSLIIVEGCDGSGKSTFVANLCHITPPATRVIHRGPLHRDPILEYIGDIMSYSPMGDSIIADRWHLGEMVYGPLYRGESRLTPAMNLYVELFLDSRGAERVWMDTPFDIVRSRLRNRGEDFLLEQHQRLVVDWYSEALTPLPAWTAVHWQQKPKPSFVEKIRDMAEVKAMRAREWMTRFPSYVGPLEPAQVLIMGDQTVNPALRNWPMSMVPWRGSPMHDILMAMTYLNFTKVGILSGTQRGRELWNRLGSPIVFTLGHAAWQYCIDREIPARRLALPPRGIPITQLIENIQERQK
jgi:thymidylate kinase